MFMMMMVVIAYPPFSSMTSSRYCFDHGYEIVNYLNAVAEDIAFIWQKVERDLT